MSKTSDPQQTQSIQINTIDEISRGRYSNLMIVSHSPDEFILDWLLNSPNGAHLVSRIIVSPSSLKQTIEALVTNLQQYEKEFGTIKVIAQKNQKVH
jgi:hypothetical protein